MSSRIDEYLRTVAQYRHHMISGGGGGGVKICPGLGEIVPFCLQVAIVCPKIPQCEQKAGSHP